MTYLLQFGSYVFGKTFSYAEVSGKRSLTATKLVRTDGSAVPTAWLAERTIEVVGTFLANAGVTMETQRDALRAALFAAPANLYLTNGRYLRNARVEDNQESTQPTWPERITDFRIRFTSGDPFFYEVTTQSSPTHALAVSGDTSVISAVGGNVAALPQISLTVAGSGSVLLNAIITNNTTGDVFTLFGNVNGGDVIVIDSQAQAVTIAGLDRMDLFDLLFPKLAVGSNTFTVAWTMGGFTNMAASWQNRWL